MRLSYRMNLPISSPEHSAMQLYSELNNHPIPHENFKILHQLHSPTYLPILESPYLHTHKPSLNGQPLI